MDQHNLTSMNMNPTSVNMNPASVSDKVTPASVQGTDSFVELIHRLEMTKPKLSGGSFPKLPEIQVGFISTHIFFKFYTYLTGQVKTMVNHTCFSSETSDITVYGFKQ